MLQTAEWGIFKRRTGWSAAPFLFDDLPGGKRGAALVLSRRIGPFVALYVPRGPLLDYSDPVAVTAVLDYLEKLARRRSALWLKIDPDVPLGEGVPNEPDCRPDPMGVAITQTLAARGWRFSESQVQFRNTVMIDLTASEDEMLRRMQQSTRYKVRYGPKHGVTIRAATSADLPILYELYAHTGARDGFLTRPMVYYQDEWGTLMQAGLAHGLIAEYEGKALAHVILFRFGKSCWYFYGASSDEHRNLMPNYALQWEAMRWAKAHGCTRYDMWGAPNDFTESDPMWGVYRFKMGFGGTVIRTIGAWDYVPNAGLYWLYEKLMPHLLDALKVMRRVFTRDRPSKTPSPNEE